MYSIEKYLAKLVCEFLHSSDIQKEEDGSKQLFDFITVKSTLYFEGLYVKCLKGKSGFKGIVTCNCLNDKLDFEVNVN